MSRFTKVENPEVSKGPENLVGLGRRAFLRSTAWGIGAAMMPGRLARALEWTGDNDVPDDPGPSGGLAGGRPAYVHTKDKVPNPQDIVFKVQYRDKDPIELVGHFWHNKEATDSGKKCPAIVELNPYRRRDGMISVDSRMYPWFAYNDYLCFRVDLQGSGDSEGALSDEYSDEELSYCTQVIEQIARHPWCDGNVGMMGESWSAINSLMVAARSDCPDALKAVIVNCGHDDRYGDDVHYMSGAMMQDNAGWPSSMWGWLAQPPDPIVVGDRWKAMWRERIRNADFWFSRWAAHQTRDGYWSRASVRDHYEKVKVPVFIMSGWQDGYKNPVDRVVRGLAAVGMGVTGLIGPWGHSYPFSGYPGPRINWLPYAVTHWWDKWLKGKEPSPETELPQLTVWLGTSREPQKSACYDDVGKWVAEDSEWPTRVSERVLYLSPDRRLSLVQPSGHAELTGSSHLLHATAMLETSSFGACDNRDLPGNLATSDNHSLCFETPPLAGSFDCFGYPTAKLNLACDKPLACIAVRLCEVSPETQASHLVSYTFFNLCYRDGDMAAPRRIEPNTAFNVRIPLNLMGHTFQKGWRIRLSVSPSFFPTMWQTAEKATITLHTGSFDGFPASALILPGRKPRSEDERMKTLLPPNADILSVCVDDYVPTTGDPERPGAITRTVRNITVDGKEGILVEKVFDYGRNRYDGHLKRLWVDQVCRENFQMLDNDPLSLTCFTSSATVLKRRFEDWNVRAETSTRVWTERGLAGQYVLKYRATVKTFIREGAGKLMPFEQKTVEGSIPRAWV